MRHNTNIIYIPQYEYVSTNQHGDRFKKTESKKINALTLSVRYKDGKDEMWRLMAICAGLNTSPTWDSSSDEQSMSIDIVALKAIK